MTHDEIRRYQDNDAGLVDCDALAVRPTDVWAGGGDDASQSVAVCYGPLGRSARVCVSPADAAFGSVC